MDAPQVGVAPWAVVGASVLGTAHGVDGTPCQDRHGYRLLPDGGLLVAVADGAGTAERSGEGAEQAVAALLASLTVGFEEASAEGGEPELAAIVRAAFLNARCAVERLADATGAPLRDYATTLTCAVVYPERLVVGQVGDGAVVAEDGDGRFFVAARPRRGEYANEVAFLTAPDGFDLDLETYPGPVRALVATTDGLLRLALELPDYAPHEPFFRPLLAFAAAEPDPAAAATGLARFLDSERVAARTDDDKTLVLAVRRSPAALAPVGLSAGEPAAVGGSGGG